MKVLTRYRMSQETKQLMLKGLDYVMIQRNILHCSELQRITLIFMNMQKDFLTDLVII